MRKIIQNIRKIVGLYNSCKRLNIRFTARIAYVTYRLLQNAYNVEAIKLHLEYSHNIKNFLLSPQHAVPSRYLQTNFERDSYPAELESRSITAANQVKTFVWFIPNCTNVWGGGHYTLFRFANFFANQFGVHNVIYIYDYNPDYAHLLEKFKSDLKKALPNCLLDVVTSFQDLPSCEAAIATTWQSAYYVDAFRHAHTKFYFMQDYESLFYPGGSLALQANYTYRFGFAGITGGHWLKEIFQSYGGHAQEYIFSTDRDIFYPSARPISNVQRIFFYGRPSTDRRAFNLGMAVLELIAFYYPEIEIVIAGLDGIEKPHFPCVLKGNLSLEKTGELYRSCDIGLALSATNLSYLPVELMASGCPVVTNDGPQVEWFCVHDHNALVAPPTPQSLFNAVKTLIDDSSLRAKLIENGLKTIAKTTWEKEMETIYHYMIRTILAQDGKKNMTQVPEGSCETENA